jgi:hypothetical protein
VRDEDLRVISLATALSLDPSLRPAAHLDVGGFIYRHVQTGRWKTP